MIRGTPSWRGFAPAQAIVLGFAGALAVGTLLLWLPVSAAPGERTSFVDPLFTATSALCVTGLTTLDTATHWSGFGLVVILLLIQLGGLGIMVVAMLVGLALARKLSVRARMTAAAETKSDGAPDVRRIVRGIFLTSIAIEGIVALLLFGRILIAYRDEYGVGRAAWFSVFHAVQTRTAGFNALDVGQMHDETWFITDILMFIGGAPAGTAGGIKVTTFAVLLFILWTELRGGTAVNIFGKRLARGVHRQAISVVLLAIAAITGVTLWIFATTDFGLDRVLFEAVSAFGTVGLSTGITPDLPDSALVLLSALMFLGRIGPLTLGSALALRERHTAYELPKERPAIG